MGEPYDIVFDIETNRLLKPSDILSLVGTLLWPGGRTETFSFCNNDGYDGSIYEGVGLLKGARAMIGHNIISFDARHINRIMGADLKREKMFDTLTATRISWPDIRDQDIADGKIPAALYGRHSLAAWGHRLDQHKGTFDAWGKWSAEMQRYCELDVAATLALYGHIIQATADRADAA